MNCLSGGGVGFLECKGLDRKRCCGIDRIKVAEVITVVRRSKSSEPVVEIAPKRCPEAQRVVRAFDVRVLLLHIVVSAIENQMLDGLRFAQCHREDAKDGYQEGPKDCCAHVESNHVDIGEYRLKQDNKVFYATLRAISW